MKATPLDFILCSLLMGLIGFGAYGLAAWVSCVSVSALGDYHVVADAAVFLLAYGVLSALAIRVLLKIRPFQLGEFDMDHPNFIYWKLRVMTMDVGRFVLAPFTLLALRPLFAKLYGAKIGKNVAIGGWLEDPPLVTFGDSVVIGTAACIFGSMTMNGKIFFGRVTIGNGVTIGANSVVMPDVEIGNHVLLAIGSVVLPGTRIPAGEQWRGNPARKWQ